jgi:3-methyladenine DNA glycosylase Tag
MPPPRSRPKNLAGYLEALSHPVFSAGMSWRVTEAKWPGIRKAFADFDPQKVARFTPKKVDRLMENDAVIRSRPKIEAVIDNAQTMIELDAEHGTFRKYLRSHAEFEDTVADLRRQFRFIGDSGAYQFLYMVDEQVPPHEDWPRGLGARRKRAPARPAG